MAYIEIRKFGGRDYRYEVENYREGKKIRHKRKYLGPVKPINKSQRKKGGRKPAVFVRLLTDEERQVLEAEKQNNQAFVRDRAKVALLSSEGKSPKEIAAQLRRGYIGILRIINGFNQIGIDFFKKRKQTGRPPKISKAQETDIVEMAVKSPKDAGLPYNNWSCRLLSLWFKEKYKQGISNEWVRMLLRRNKVTFTMPRHKLLKAIPCLQAAFKKS